MVAYCWKSMKPGTSTEKESFYEFSQSLWALRPSRSLCFRSVCPRFRFALKMAKTAKRAITCSVPHTSNKIFWQNFWTCQSCEIGCTNACRYITPGLYAWRPCHAEKLALITSPHHECNTLGSQTGDARVQWHCHLLLIGQPWSLAFAIQRKYIVHKLLKKFARAIKQVLKLHLEFDQNQNSIHKSRSTDLLAQDFS